MAGHDEHPKDLASQSKLQVGGIILAGGRSTRMGQSKPALLFGGETLLQRVVRLTGDIVSPVVVAAASTQILPPLPQTISIVADTIPDAGPLVGLLSGLYALKPTCEAVFVVACDQPLITGPFIRVLIDALGSHAAVIVEHGGRLHPLTGVYRTDLLPALTSYLDEGHRNARDFAKSVHAHVIDSRAFTPPASLERAVRNINTPQDYHTLHPSE